MGRMVFSEDDVQRVLDYLKQRVDVFKEIRRKLGIGEELGLASFPQCHDFVDGFIDEIILKNGKPHVDVFYPTYKLGMTRVELEEAPLNRIVVMPAFNEDGRAYIISVYFSPGRLENKQGIALDESFFSAPEQVLEGIIAHECAEYIWNFKWETISRESLNAMGERFSSWYERFIAYPDAIRCALEEQYPADFLASAAGFGEEMTRCLEFKKNRCLLWEDFPPNSAYALRYKRPQIFAAELQARIDFIKGVC